MRLIVVVAIYVEVLQATPCARHEDDLDSVGDELLLHPLRLPHLPPQHVLSCQGIIVIGHLNQIWSGPRI